MNDGVYKPEQVVTKHATKVGILKFWQLNYGIGKFQDLIQFTYNWRVVSFSDKTDISRYRFVHSVASGIVFVIVI